MVNFYCFVSIFCEDYPDDARCRALFRAYCFRANNMDDTRCRQEFSEWCQENPRNVHCVPFALNRSKTYCEQYSNSSLCRKIATNVTDFCENNPENEGCAIIKKIVQSKPKLFQKIQDIRNSISNLKINVQPLSGIITSANVGG